MIQKERYNYIMNYGGYLTWPVKLAFEEGKVIPGMPYYLVEILYGEPDLTIKCPYQSLLCDKVFVYQTNDTHTVGSVSVKDGIVLKSSGQVSEKCRF